MISRNQLELSSSLCQDAPMAGHKGWGGRRPGAGRPRVVREPQRLAVDFERPDLDALKALAERRGTSVADLVRRAVSQYLRRAERD